MQMLILLAWACFLVVDCNHLHTHLQVLPKFGDAYHITGQVITYQFSSIEPFGASFKVTPETTETKVNLKECFRIDGTFENPVSPQSVFPNFTDFQSVHTEYYKGRHCAVLESICYWGKRKNIYRLWIADILTKPMLVHYEMWGSTDSWAPTTTNVKCTHLPGLGPEHRILANSMQEFVGGAGEISRDHEHLFHHYKEKFGKSYKAEKEMEHRKKHFIRNVRYIHFKNRANLSHRLAVSHLADRTPEEMAVLRGRLRSREPSKGVPLPTPAYPGLVLPESLDWRLYGAVSPVEDQAVYGSCWNFATTGTLEGALFLKNGMLTLLSQQVLMDCSWGFGNRACDGGRGQLVYKWIMKHGGIASTESYGPYLGQNGYCHYSPSELMPNTSGHVNVEPANVAALKAALCKHGPVAANMDVSPRSFTLYSDGIYYEPNCRNSSMDLDRAVLVVGDGLLQGESYWLFKNSWSTYWGSDGYILMSMKENNCGVTTMATYPVLA